MKFHPIHYCLLAAWMFTPILSHAQTRYADLQVVMTAPANHSTIQWGDTANYSFYVKNNGPDSILTSDSFTVGLLFFDAGIPVTGVSIGVGDSMAFNDGAHVWNTQADTSFDLDFCVEVHSESAHLVDTNSANDTDCVTNLFSGNNTGLSKVPSGHQTLKIFPNPTTNQLFIRLDKVPQTYFVEVFDMLGRIKMHVYNPTPNNRIIKISTAHWPEGLYWVKVKTMTNRYLSKFLVKRH